MNYRELAKELGLNSSMLLNIENRGLVKSHGAAALLASFDDEDVKVIRQCCLFSMLGIPDEAAFSIVKGESDLKPTLKKYLDDILSDEKNHTQAAIVIQNIRRECQNIDELDPVPFLQHIKELKASGGTFYDVNSGRLEERKAATNDNKPGKSGLFGGLFGGLMGSSSKEDEPRGRNTDVYNGRKPDDSPDAGKSGSYDSSEASTDKIGDEKKDTSEIEDGISRVSDTSDEEKTATDEETKNSSDSTQNERWSPYTTHGYGDSNMGSGNWHGWSPGYGTYTTKIGARERINNGEKTCPYPARRFLARIVDTTIVTLIGNAILKIGFRVNTGLSLETVMYCEMVFWLFELMIEPLLLATIGTTPGKWIMGIKVRDSKSKGKLDIKQAYIRALKLAWHGFGFMIPIFSIYKRGVSYIRCRMNDTMQWDEGIDVELDDDKQTRIVLCVVAIILLNVFDEFVAKQAMLPQNRGDITVEQFRENLVELMKYTGYTGDILDNYKVTAGSNGYVRSVSITFTDEQDTADRYNQMYLAFLAFAGAADGSNGINLMMTSVNGRMKTYYNSFVDSYCGVTIQNISDSTIVDENGYSNLYMALYGATPAVPAFNQTFTMIKE